MKHSVSGRAICPYYKHEDVQVIYCESDVEGSIATYNFADRTTAKIHKLTLCQKSWWDCPRAKEMEKKV